MSKDIVNKWKGAAECERAFEKITVLMGIMVYGKNCSNSVTMAKHPDFLNRQRTRAAISSKKKITSSTHQSSLLKAELQCVLYIHVHSSTRLHC